MAKGRRVVYLLIGALLAAGLLVASAEGDVAYGVSAAKGCHSPSFVGQPDVCFYTFSNVTVVGIGQDPSKDTVQIIGANDAVRNFAHPADPGFSYADMHGGDPGFDPVAQMLPSLQLIFSPAAPDPGAPMCTGGSGLGTAASPYIGASSCTLPYGASVTSVPAGWYTVAPDDFNLPGSQLNDQMTFTWKDLCDVAPSATCNPDDPNDAEAPSSTRIVQYNSTITTALSAVEINAGQSVHDSATIAYDTTPPIVNGTVTYRLYTDNTCSALSTTPPLNQSVAYTGGAVPDSAEVVFPQGGHFWFQASFSGDFAHGVAPSTSVCTEEPLHVIATPTLTTKASPPTATVPAFVTDDALLLNTTADAGGTITFQLYDLRAPNGLTCPDSAKFGAPVVVNVHGPGHYVTSSVPILNASAYQWVATYSGDANNKPAGPTGCNDPAEEVVIDRGGLALTTNAAAPLPKDQLPTSLSDVATLQAQLLPVGFGPAFIQPTGTLTFHLYTDPNCGAEVPGSPVTTPVNGGLDPTTGIGTFQSPSINVAAAGTYSWRVEYSGDANYNDSGLVTCDAAGEVVVVPKVLALLTSTASSTQNLPGSITDVAHLVTKNASAGGMLAFHLYSDPTCATEVAGSPKNVPVNGPGDYTSPAFTLSTAGAYFWRVSYTGDSNTLAVPLTACGAAGESSQVGPTGTIELCKAPDGGAAGQTFNFTLLSLTTGFVQKMSVVGGSCSAPFGAGVGKWQITEDLTSGLWSMVGATVIPSKNLIDTSTAGGWVKVKVVKSGETQVTFTNKQAGATLKVCKYSKTPQFQGSSYQFTIGTSTIVTAVAGSSQATAGCSFPVGVEPGGIVKVAETVPANEKVATVSVSSNASLSSVTKAGVVKVVVGPGQMSSV